MTGQLFTTTTVHMTLRLYCRPSFNQTVKGFDGWGETWNIIGRPRTSPTTDQLYLVFPLLINPYCRSSKEAVGNIVYKLDNHNKRRIHVSILSQADRSMEAFKKLIAFIRETNTVNFIAQLPYEVAHMILEYLDDESFFSAAKTSRQWAKVCRNCNRRKTNINNNCRKKFQAVQRSSTSVSTETLWLTKKIYSKATYKHLQMSRKANKYRDMQHSAKTCSQYRLRL